jgi:hypothetical protein
MPASSFGRHADFGGVIYTSISVSELPGNKALEYLTGIRLHFGNALYRRGA